MNRDFALLVGTTKGVFGFWTDRGRRDWEMTGPHLPGWEVYSVMGVTSNEWRGVVMLIVSSISFLYIALVMRSALVRAAGPEPEVGEEEEPHIGGTIWPFVGSLAAVLLVIGAVGPRWMLIPGIILFAGTGVGWFLDIEHQWQPTALSASPAGPPREPSALERHEHGDEDDRD